jgi:hypothetical protein
MKKKYGLGHFLLDFVLIVLTGGLWGVYLVLRALNRK